MTGLLQAGQILGCVGVADGRVVERIRGAMRAAWEEVSVGLQGEGGRVVAELLLDEGLHQRCPADLAAEIDALALLAYQGQSVREEPSWAPVRMTAILPAPEYVLARAACPTLVIWHADGRFPRLEGDPCEEYAAALTASWRLRPSSN